MLWVACELLQFAAKSETSDSFVNHFDSHFAYLKTLDFSFNIQGALYLHHYQQQ